MEKRVTIESVAKQLSEAKEEIARLRVDNKGLSTQLNRVEKTQQRHKKLLRTTDEHQTVKMLDAYEERVQTLSNRLRTEITKNVVCSEVTRLYPHMWPNLVRALDNPDHWWDERENWTISQWRVALTNAANAA